MLTKYVLKHFHFCCGLGGGAKGFNQNKEVVGHLQAEWRCIGGVDVDAGALRDFQRLAGVPGTQMDLFTREQYTAFHGKEPPADWREATPADIRRAAGFQDPDVVFISSPCKGASGLLSEALSLTPKYQALNELTLRCVWLMCEAWQHNPPGLIVFENVPRLATRGRHLLDQIVQVLNFFGYAVSETTHDCGELGGLAQSRKRFLLVARHVEKVPPFLYEPEKKSLQSVGAVLGRMPHRPFTTLEMAALQSLVDPEEMLELDGLSDQAWRERIGNAVPPKAAEAIAGVMAQTLLLAKQGETFLLSHMPVWVRPVAVGLSLASELDKAA